MDRKCNSSNRMWRGQSMGLHSVASKLFEKIDDSDM
jgi:hypothetical protein